MQQSSDGPMITPGLTVAALLDLPDAERHLINWMRRQSSCSLAEVVAYLNSREEAIAQLDTLMAKGYVQAMHEGETIRYRVWMAPRRPRPLPPQLMAKLDALD